MWMMRHGAGLLLLPALLARGDGAGPGAGGEGGTGWGSRLTLPPWGNTTLHNTADLPPAIIGNILTTAAGGQSVGDMQEELQELLFGGHGNLSVKALLVDGDRAEFLDYSQADYDQYSYDTPMMLTEANGDVPLAAESRQRRPLRRRRPYRLGRPGQLGVGTSHSPRRHSLPPVRAPEVHKVPGRIQGLPGSRFGGTRGPFPSAGQSSAADCDFYTEELCLGVTDYPRQQIVELLGANRRISGDMIADVEGQSADDLIDGVSSNQESTYTFSHYFGREAATRREDPGEAATRDFAQDGGFLCPSEIKYAKPKRGKTAQGTWKDIVNVNDYTQTLRMEKCLKPGGSCSYVSHHYKSQCSQVYNYHRLLSWDEERGLHMDIYKVPTCCSCHIMGYSYVYPPLSTKDRLDSSSGSAPAPLSRPPPQSRPPPPPVRPAPARPPAVRPALARPATARPPPQPFVDFGSPSAAAPPALAARPPPPSPPRRPAPPRQQSPDLDNFIPDFNPQQELEAFMDTIGGDNFKDFGSFGGKTGARPTRQQRPNGFRRPRPGLSAPRRRADSLRRGDGFGPGGRPGGGNMADRSKLESIPLETSPGRLVRKQLDTQQASTPQRQPTVTQTGQSVNYGYHPIIDFFRPYRNS